MPVRKAFRVLAAYYRKTARFSVFVILLVALAAPVLAAGPGSLNLSPNINVNANSPFGCGFPLFPSRGSYQASGGVTASGTYSGNVYLEGSVTIYGHDKATDKPEVQTLALPQGGFSPSPMGFPGQSQAGLVGNPQANSNVCQPVIDGYTYWVAASTTSGCFTGACLLTETPIESAILRLLTPSSFCLTIHSTFTGPASCRCDIVCPCSIPTSRQPSLLGGELISG